MTKVVPINSKSPRSAKTADALVSGTAKIIGSLMPLIIGHAYFISVDFVDDKNKKSHVQDIIQLPILVTDPDTLNDFVLDPLEAKHEGSIVAIHTLSYMGQVLLS